MKPIAILPLLLLLFWNLPLHAQPPIKGIHMDTWYKGSLAKYPIWLYLDSKNYDNEVKAYYGYNSSKGAPIKLQGDLSGSTLRLTLQSKPGKETFELRQSLVTGELEGSWSMGSKSFSVQLQPQTLRVNNTQQLLQQAATLKLPITDGYLSGFTEDAFFKDYYKVQNAAFFVPNLRSLIPEVLPFPEGAEYAIKPSSESGKVVGKVRLSNGQTLLLFSIDLDREDNYMEHQGEPLSKTAVPCIALFDQNAQLKKAVLLGNDGGYHLGFDWEWNKKDQITLIWTYFERAGARVQSGQTKDYMCVENGDLVLGD